MAEDCTRLLVEIGGENYYLLVGDAFCSVTVPRENDPMQTKERVVAETICRKITAIMRLRRIVKNRGGKMSAYIVNLIMAEVERATAKHPRWPGDPVHAAAIVSEEAGELVRAANRFYDREGGTVEDMEEEAVQVGASAIRFLLGIQAQKDMAEKLLKCPVLHFSD